MIFSKLIKKLRGPKSRAFDFTLPANDKAEMRDIQKSYARIFATQDGERVLAHLQKTTFIRVLPSDATDQSIRYIEGQRAIVAQILRNIAAGRTAN